LKRRSPHLPEIIVRDFQFLCERYGFRVSERVDDKRLGSFGVFANDGVRVIVEYDQIAGECDVCFEFLRVGRRRNRISLFAIIQHAGGEDQGLLRADSEAEVRTQMAVLARQCEKYAAKALLGSADFFLEIEQFNASLQGSG